MNKQAIEHFHESKYCFYIDNRRCLIRVRTAKNDTIKKIEVIWNEWCKFYKKRIVTKLKKSFTDNLFDYYDAILDSPKPSHEYIIKITDGDGKIYFLSDEGLTDKFVMETTFLNEFMSKFPNEKDIQSLNKNLTGRIYYQIFPDRFACSNFKKKYINMDWNEEKKIDNNHFFGGDLKGIEEKIPYLHDLGIGGIYLNPIHPSNSAHKYDVNDYLKVDPMFGTIADLKSLIETAHKYDIKICLDMVFNHCAYNNILFQDVVKNGKKSKYYNWFFVSGDKPNYKKRNYLTFADVANMPKLNTNNPEVLEYFKKVVLFWADLGVDGFRLDVAFEVSYFFWREIKETLVKKYPDCFLIGEDWMNTEKRLDKGQWDSVMNYPLRFGLMQYFGDETRGAEWITERLAGLYVRYPNNVNEKLINLLDSHDTERFIDTLKFNMDYYMLAYAILMFYPGVPQLYYGDEIFMNGKQDPFNRKGMKWDSEEFNSENHKFFKKILDLRKFNALKFGDVAFENKDDVAFIKRKYRGITYKLAFYKGNVEKKYRAKNIVLSLNYSDGKFSKTGFVVTKE